MGTKERKPQLSVVPAGTSRPLLNGRIVRVSGSIPGDQKFEPEGSLRDDDASLVGVYSLP